MGGNRPAHGVHSATQEALIRTSQIAFGDHLHWAWRDFHGHRHFLQIASCRSVDSQQPGRAIEPREYYPLEPSSWTARGQHRHPATARGVRSGRGRRTGHSCIRVAQEPGRPCDSISRGTGSEGAAKPEGPWPQAGVGPVWSEDRRTGWYRPAKRNEAWWEGSQGVGASHSTREAGEPEPRGPWGGKGMPRRGAAGGHPRRDSEPWPAVPVTPPDSVAACETTTGRAGCVNCARTDLRAMMPPLSHVHHPGW
jgi:hypothetical protein